MFLRSRTGYICTADDGQTRLFWAWRPDRPRLDGYHPRRSSAGSSAGSSRGSAEGSAGSSASNLRQAEPPAEPPPECIQHQDSIQKLAKKAESRPQIEGAEDSAQAVEASAESSQGRKLRPRSRRHLPNS